MDLNVHVHHDPELHCVLERILQHVKNIDEADSRLSEEDQRFLHSSANRAKGLAFKLRGIKNALAALVVETETPPV